MPPRVLLVDDQQTAMNIRQRLLEQYGFTVRLAINSITCLDALEKFAIDVVVLDYRLNDGVNGEELARSIRARWPNTPLIMLTGVMDLPDTARDVVDRVFIKGWNQPQEVIDAIRELAENRGTLDESNC
jgi:CheY-like chemotaxis protein